MNPIRAVAFDLDGLMFNTEDVYFAVGSAILERRGHEFTRELSDAMMGRPPRAGFEVMIAWCSLTDSWETLAAESQEEYLRIMPNKLAPMPGMIELLEWLEARELPRCICTSSARRLVDATLARFSLQPRFEFVLTSEDVSNGKPHPEIYQRAQTRFGVGDGEMLVLEDSQTGCTSAAAANAYVVAVPGNHSARHDFSMAHLEAESLQDPRIYDRLQAR